MFLRLLAVQLDIESRRHIAIKTLVREDEADSGMSIGVLTHHFPTRAQFIELFSTYSGSYVSSTRIGYRSRLSVQVVQLSPTGFQFPSSSLSFARQRQIVKPSAPLSSIIYLVEEKPRNNGFTPLKTTRRRHQDKTAKTI